MTLDTDPASSRSEDPPTPLDPPAAGRSSRGHAVGRLAIGVLSLAVVVIAVVAISSSRSEAPSAGPISAAPPSPLFGDVDQLTPTSLPEGWGRCGGGPSTRPDADDDWWAQSFGPMVDGRCTPLITVSQVPPVAEVDFPDLTEDGKVGGAEDDPDAIVWSDDANGSLGLFTWARGQGLLVEACCGPDAEEHFDAMAVAALSGTREHEPARCTGPESDLDLEDEVDNYFGSRDRMYDRDDCPLRRDIVTMETTDPGHHCWPNVTFLYIGTPVGNSYEQSDIRAYTRDAEGVFSGAVPDPDLDTTVPRTAVDTGYHQGDRRLWIDETDDERIYVVVDDGKVEAWPRDREPHMCA